MQSVSLAAWQDGVLSSLARVGQQHDIEPLAARLGELSDLLGDDLIAFEKALATVLDARRRPRFAAATNTDLDGLVGRADEPHLAERAALHLLRQPGKRVRPLCVLLAARLGRGDPAEVDATHVRNLAVACELVHAATLLHDDVIDEGTQRRGAPAARMVFGNSATILAGDHLLVRALQLVDTVGEPQLIQSLLETISAMVAAEAQQLERRGHFDPSREAYLSIVRGKTAALFRWGLYAGGTVAALGPAALRALEQAGMALGIAFQLADDLLDLRGDPAVTGKNAFADLHEGKITWPVLIACERNASLADRLRGIIADGCALSQSEAASLARSILESGAVEATQAFALEHGERAQQLLADLPPGAAQRALCWVVRSAVDRVS